MAATRVFARANVHIERGDRVALVGANGTGKSTLMRMLSGVEAPDNGDRNEGHRVVTQYFAQDEATRLDPALTVYETLATGSPVDMVPAIRNILGGFLFTEDDIYKRVRVLSGGERTRLAVARMLLRPSNTLLLDEPTNHLDIDSTNVLLDALTDYSGTLIFVSHDRYFVDHLATKVLEVGNGDTVMYLGTYEEFRWSKQASSPATEKTPPVARRATRRRSSSAANSPQTTRTAATHKRQQMEDRRRQRRIDVIKKRIADLEERIATRENAIRALETKMARPDFYTDEAAADEAAKRHQTLMWEVGDLMSQWEALEKEADEQISSS